MALFTFALDYAGGTYLSQCSASSVEDAIRLWLREMLPREAIGGASVEVFAAFSEKDDFDLVQVNGLERVWCATAVGAGGLALLNVIQTAH